MSEIKQKDKAENILGTPFPDTHGSGAMLLKYSQDEISEMRSTEIGKRFKAICKNDGISLKSLNSDFQKYLFITHSAFQTKKKKKRAGRPSKRNGYEGYKLYTDVQAWLKDNNTRSVAEAFEFLVKSKKWELEPESLDSYYYSIIKTNPFIKWDRAGFGNISDKGEMRKSLLEFIKPKSKN